MKKDAAQLMIEEKFRTIIDNSNRGRNLKECLITLPEEELFGFRYWWENNVF